MSALSGKRFVVVLFALASICAAFLIRFHRRSDSNPVEGPVSQALIDRFVELEAREKRADETAWAKEMVAQECGRVFESLWDSLNAATNKLELLASFPVGEVILGDWRSSGDLVHGIELRAVRSDHGEGWTPDAARGRIRP